MTTFSEMSQETVSNFLSSVVLVDDKAFSNGSLSEPQKVTAKPGRGMKKISPATDAPARKADFQDIDTQAVIEAFAEKGLVCTVLNGKNNNSLRALFAADVVIFDWQMEGDDGKRATEFILNLVKEDDGNRSRFICIYSGVEDLDQIAKKLRKKQEFKSFKPSRCGFYLSKENVHITILSKAGGTSGETWKHRSVKNTELPERIIKEYADATSGLLEHATLYAIASVRANTHKLLNRFSKEIDAPFVSHRVFSNPMEDVKNHATPLIADEIQSIIEQAEVSNKLNRNVILTWLETQPLNGNIIDRSKEEALEVARHYVENGITEQPPTCDSDCVKAAHETLYEERSKAKFTALLGNNAAQKSEKKFAALTSLVTSYQHLAPVLRTGTIITDTKNYYLCIMPACDSIRIPQEGRTFPFLLMKKNEQRRSFYVKNGKNYHGLSVSLKPYEAITEHFFPPEGAKEVVAQLCPTCGKWIFSCGEDSSSYQWVADLKPAHAQNVINAFAAQLSRVGLTESEWLRVGKPKIFGGSGV